MLELPEIIKSISTKGSSEIKFNLSDNRDLSCTKPINLIIMGEIKTVLTWKDILMEALSFLYNDWDSKIIEEMARSKFKLSGQRIYLSYDSTELFSPKQIENSKIFIETNLSANRIITFLQTILNKYDIPLSDIVIHAHNASPLNIDI